MSATSSDKSEASQAGIAGASAQPGVTPGAGGAQTPDERRDQVDRSLDASLAEFDAMLLKEQQAAAAKRAEHRGGGPGGTGSGEGGEGEGGSGSGSGGAAGQEKGAAAGKGKASEKGKAGGRTADRSTEPPQGSPEKAGERGSRNPAGGMAGPGDSASVPADVGDGRDDDVVARQLREAATKEQDPVIREKLWEEYRRYKRGGS